MPSDFLLANEVLLSSRNSWWHHIATRLSSCYTTISFGYIQHYRWLPAWTCFSTTHCICTTVASRRIFWHDVDYVPPRRHRQLSVVHGYQPSVTELFRLLRLVSGTVYRSTSHPRSHCQSSAVALWHISSGAASCDYVVVPEKWHHHFQTH